MPALTVNSYGSGKAYYQAFRDGGAFADMLVSELLKECGIGGAFDGELPEGVTAHSRTDGENTYVFIQNFTTEKKTIKTECHWMNAENGHSIKDEFTVSSYQTLILLQK